MEERLTIKEAAERLGISADTVRRRLKRGELAGEQHPTAQGFTWLVAMPAGSGVGAPDTASVQAPAPNVQPASSGEGTTVAELWRALEEEGKATAAAKDETISRLAAEVAYLRERENTEIAFLREQLDQRSRELAAERERFDVIQQLALQRIEALTATVAEQREEALVAVQEPPGSTEGGAEGDPSSWLASVIRKVRGG
jgi:hypothetical protein